MADETKTRMNPIAAGAIGFVLGVLFLVVLSLALLGTRTPPGVNLAEMKPVARGVSEWEVLLRWEDPETGHTVYAMRAGGKKSSAVAVVPKGTGK